MAHFRFFRPVSEAFYLDVPAFSSGAIWDLIITAYSLCVIHRKENLTPEQFASRTVGLGGRTVSRLRSHAESSARCIYVLGVALFAKLWDVAVTENAHIPKERRLLIF